MTPEHLSAARRKELGAFYTPTVMAEKLAGWAIRAPEDRVLDPSFGGQVFLRAGAKRLDASLWLFASPIRQRRTLD